MTNKCGDKVLVHRFAPLVAVFPAALALCFGPTTLAAREWTDASGHYHVEADLIGVSDSGIVIKRANHDLVLVPLKSLSEKDRKYLESEEAAQAAHAAAEAQQVWTLRGGLKVTGRIVNYGRRDVVIQRHGGKVYVNDRLFDNLDGVYREMVPRIVAHFENTEIDGKKGLEAWLIKQKGQPRTFTCEGVMLELPSGDMYGVPFFFFSDADRAVLEPGWQRWLAADNDRQQQEQQRFMLESQAQAYQANQQAQRQIMQLHLQLEAYNAGLFDLWEVSLLPAAGTRGMPQLAVVPGRNSQQAAAAAMQKFPGYVAGTIAKVTRKY